MLTFRLMTTHCVQYDALPRLPGGTRMMSREEKCFLCDNTFTFGPYRYEGRYVRPLHVHICDCCLLPNQDGLAPDYEPKLLAHLSAQGLPLPARNSNGLLILR
jgi:hypothetical protein